MIKRMSILPDRACLCVRASMECTEFGRQLAHTDHSLAVPVISDNDKDLLDSFSLFQILNFFSFWWLLITTRWSFLMRSQTNIGTSVSLKFNSFYFVLVANSTSLSWFDIHSWIYVCFKVGMGQNVNDWNVP